MPTIEDLEKRVDSIDLRISDLYDKLNKVTNSVGIIGEKVDSLKEKIIEFNTKLDKILEKPSKRWDLIITIAITTIVAAIITATISKLF